MAPREETKMADSDGLSTSKPADTPDLNTVEVDGVSLAYPDGTPALDDVSLNVGLGEFVSIIGPSGCGKSTLLQLVSGILRPTSGGLALTAAEGSTTPRIGYVFQDHRLLPWRTVRRNLELVLQAAGFPRAEWASRIEELLELAGIPHVADSWPMRLSGGQRQRVAIVRALVIDPTIVLMDEPFSALDEVTGQVLREELIRIWSSTNQTVLFVTHSIREATYLSDRIIVFSRGPGRVLREVDVDLPRPRAIDAPDVVRFEQQLTNWVRDKWGADDLDTGDTA